MSIPKDVAELKAHLPYKADKMTLRTWRRSDIDTLLGWPTYPAPYARFQPTFAGEDRNANDAWLAEWEADKHRLPLMVDLDDVICAGYIVLVDVDWKTGEVRNIGVQLKPDLCDKGLGTRMMHLLSNWAFTSGLTSIRFDVAASNPRAIRCYEKAGFVRVEEFWREHPRLSAINLDAPENAHIIPHSRMCGQIRQFHFYWMERTNC